MPTEAVRDDPKNAQGAVPFGFNSKPPMASPDNNRGASVDPQMPDGYDIDFGSVAPIKDPRATTAPETSRYALGQPD